MFPEIDLRDHAMSCADATMQAFDRLAVKTGFVFVADHDPTALRYMFEAERAGQFTWSRTPVTALAMASAPYAQATRSRSVSVLEHRACHDCLNDENRLKYPEKATRGMVVR